MRFVVDECVGPTFAAWLTSEGHDVYSVFDQARGMKDPAILRKAFEEKRVPITADADFGALVFRDNYSHAGVIFLRLEDDSVQNRISVLEGLLRFHSDQLVDEFIVVTQNSIRVARKRQELE